MAFILILSPSNAPPDLRFEGSTEIIAIVLSSKSYRKRLTISSTKDDFPDPPVPVIPSTGDFFLLAILSRSLIMAVTFSGLFSAAEISLDIFT